MAANNYTLKQKLAGEWADGEYEESFRRQLQVYLVRDVLNDLITEVESLKTELDEQKRSSAALYLRVAELERETFGMVQQ